MWWGHLVAALGDVRVDDLDDATIRPLRRRLGTRRTTFNRCLALLIASMNRAGCLHTDHPIRRVRRYKEKQKTRVLSRDENHRLNDALNEWRKKKGGWRYADLLALLILTGLRRDEWRLGRWEWVNWTLALYNIPETKTGARTVYLSAPALEILMNIHRAGGNPARGFIFPAVRDKRKAMSWSWTTWRRLIATAGISDVRCHDLRHTAGSYAHSFAGLSQRAVADLLGHSRLETSGRYIHDDEKRRAAEAVAKAVTEDWKPSN